MELNEAQKKAVEYLSGPLLVLAGPGTGKTQLLSQKVAYILKNTDTNPENILCLTFTESGASNMRERLKTIIGRDALKVNIGTYHSFGTEILLQYKNYSESYDRQLDNAIDEVMQYKIVKTIQDKLPARDILRGDSVKNIISVISEAKGADLTAADLRLIAEQNIEDSRVLSETISPYLKNVVPRVFNKSYENAYKPIYDILKEFQTTRPIVKKIERVIGEMARDLASALEEAGGKKITPLTKWKDKYFEKDEHGSYRLKDRVSNRKLLSVSNVMKAYGEYLSENGLYDFDDMIQEAVKALKNDEGFRLTLQEKYQFIMLDEFQDTNPAQLSIVKALTDYEQPQIMAVGDDDQAIYEFQGALSSNLTDFKEYYHAEVVQLTENYRSTQEILDFSHDVINQAPDRFMDKKLTAHRENPKGTLVRRAEFKTSDAEYAFVANAISQLIARGVKQSEIAVISYKTKYFEPLLPYLKSHPEIKIAYEKKQDLFNDQKIHEIIILSKYVQNLADGKKRDVQPLEVLACPFWYLDALSLVKLAGKARAERRELFEVLSEADDENMKSAAEFIAGLVAKSLTEPLSVVLNEIVGKMEVEKMDEYERCEFYENLAALKGKIRKHFGDKALKLQDFIEMLEDYETASMPMSASNPYKEADDAVRILTAHKAKGLEFEHVFIISADHAAWGKGKGNNNLLVLPKNLTQIRHTGTTDSEKLRILYVALTRAKKSLTVTNSLSDFLGRSPERLEYLDEHEENGGIVSPFVPDKQVHTMYNVDPPKVHEENLKNWLSPYLNLTPDVRTLYLERAKSLKMSASALTSFIDIVHGGPEAFFQSYILQAPREPLTEQLAFGDLVHKTFEKVTKENISDEEAISYYLSELEKLEIETKIKESLKERGPADLTVSLSEFKDILRQGLAEVDFRSENLVVNGVPVTGKIDHMIVDEDEKTIEIYDYKTGGYAAYKWRSNLSLYKNMLQLIFYKMLLNHSKKYANYKVLKAHILYVRPDQKDGEVHDKLYEFNAEDEEEFYELLSKIYEKVENLDFLDDEKMMKAAEGQVAFKDVKDFIALLLDKESIK